MIGVKKRNRDDAFLDTKENKENEGRKGRVRVGVPGERQQAQKMKVDCTHVCMWRIL